MLAAATRCQCFSASCLCCFTSIEKGLYVLTSRNSETRKLTMTNFSIAGLPVRRSVFTGRAFSTILCLAALLLFLAPFTFGQTTTTADTLGAVTDTSGGVVPGAKVTIKSVD